MSCSRAHHFTPRLQTVSIAVMRLRTVLYCFVCFFYQLSAQDITLQAPLTTPVYAEAGFSADSSAIQAQIQLPEDMPDDLGVGAFIKDDDGQWFQLAWQGRLKPGHMHLHFPLDAAARWQSEPHQRAWHRYHQSLTHEFGLYFWSASTSRCTIRINNIRCVTATDSEADQWYISNCTWDHYDNEQHVVTVETGQRWELRCQPQPLPANPYDPESLQLQLIISDDIGNEHVFDAFYKQPMRFVDRGNSEAAIADGQPVYAARFRPMKAGRYAARLEARWSQEQSAPVQRTLHLPDIVVSGPHRDPYVRVDKQDPRFFSAGADDTEFVWPIGMNIRSVTDPRGTERTHSQPTPDRMLSAYKTYLDRCARAGVTSAEIWMSSWNLALEWKDGWPGFHGLGAYHEGNAARLDALLDYAWERGIRVILVINNHGQASTKADAEWSNSPYNKRNGGLVDNPQEMFTDPDVIDMQQQLRRYIIARYADHPGILMWKLWTEMNLTRGRRGDLITWHKNAFDDFHRLDHYYRHPCATHWSGDYNVPDRNLIKMPEMDVIAIDAYHNRRFLPGLLYDSTLHQHRGLARFHKPVVVTEFGGNWSACPLPQLEAEHAAGAWAALMSGHGTSPHLWWFEWVDQNDWWLPYRAINNFIQGEDLRSSKARSVKLDIRNEDNQRSDRQIWTRAWARPGTILAYCIDYEWGRDGTSQPLHQGLSIVVSKQARAGDIALEWWDASLGTIIQQQTIQHQGGELRLQVPDFRRHIAFKLKRLDQSDTGKSGDL